MKHFSTLVFTLFFASTLFLGGCYYDNEQDLYPGGSCDTTGVTFNNSIAPIFSTYCNSCHSGSSPSAGISTDNYSSVVENIDRIVGAVNHADGYMPMPQGGNKLSACELSKINAWINLGKPEN